MNVVIGILILCTIPAVISVWFHSFKKRCKLYELGKIILFYLLTYSGIMSFIKILSGEGTWRLVESFDTILPMTYVHYGIPYVVISVVTPLILKVLFREKLFEWIEKVLSVVLVEIVCVYLVTSKISNYCYVICIAVAAIVAIGMLLLGKHSTYCCKVDWKKCGIPYLCAILVYIITVVLYMPNEMVITNTDEFVFSFWDFLGITVSGSFILFVLFGILGVYILSTVQMTWCTFGVFAWSVMGYLQAMFLNGQMQAMDGFVQKWSGFRIGINLFVWIGFVIVLYILMKKKRTIWLAAVKYVSIYICLIQMVSLITLLVTIDVSGEKGITKNGWTELHKENNVVVFALDWFDNQILEAALQEEPELLSELKDFTYYPNTTSKYAFTQMAVPYLLTGIEWEEGMTEDAYVEKAFSEETFLKTLLDNSYNVKLYTEEVNVTGNALQNMDNYDVKAVDCKYGKAIEMTSNAAKYKMVPFAIKSYYSYATSDFVQILDQSNSYAFSELGCIEFYEDITQNGLKISQMQSEGCFTFLHLWGTHGPFLLTREVKSGESTMVDEAIASIKVVSAYIEEMRRINVYDNATIIITADHGHNCLYTGKAAAEEMGLRQVSSPILFVKEANQINEMEMKVNHAPVSHDEFHATVLKAVGIDYTSYGRAFDEVAETEQRERVFELFRYGHMPYVRYIIDGDVADENAWRIDYCEDNIK